MVATRKIDLIAVVGPTASGKSALALQIAKAFNGEIIAADSRTIYKDMDIGTAKPSPGEQKLVPHYLIDVTSIDKPLTAAQFKQLAEKVIDDIQDRGRLPIIVGGSGLYIDAVLFGYSFAAKSSPIERDRLNRMTIEELQEELSKRSISLPLNSKNKRHLVRALETGGIVKKDKKLRQGTLLIGLNPSKEDLKINIERRVDSMLAAGLETEVHKLFERYGSQSKALNTIGYKEWLDYFSGRRTVPEVREGIIKNTQAYAKRQLTWFKRNNFIHWFESPDRALSSVESELNN